jgi:ribonuclease R
LDAVKERPDFHVIQVVLLRSMMQAVYSDNNVGHFGLAFPAYTHFTSPIRRYPDLMVHRALKHLLAGEKPETFDYTHRHLQAMGEHCSATERRADDATRDASDTLKCAFMLDHIGETYPGIISGVNSFGIFVELDGIYVSGLVHITALDYDYFHFDPIGHRLTGDRTGKVYRLGDAIAVKVAAVNVDERKIDFVLADADGRTKATKPRRGGRRPAKGKKAPDAASQAGSDAKPESRSRRGRRRRRS